MSNTDMGEIIIYFFFAEKRKQAKRSGKPDGKFRGQFTIKSKQHQPRNKRKTVSDTDTVFLHPYVGRGLASAENKFYKKISEKRKQAKRSGKPDGKFHGQSTIKSKQHQPRNKRKTVSDTDMVFFFYCYCLIL